MIFVRLGLIRCLQSTDHFGCSQTLAHCICCVSKSCNDLLGMSNKDYSEFQSCICFVFVQLHPSTLYSYSPFAIRFCKNSNSWNTLYISGPRYFGYHSYFPWQFVASCKSQVYLSHCFTNSFSWRNLIRIFTTAILAKSKVSLHMAGVDHSDIYGRGTCPRDRCYPMKPLSGCEAPACKGPLMVFLTHLILSFYFLPCIEMLLLWIGKDLALSVVFGKSHISDHSLSYCCVWFAIPLIPGIGIYRNLHLVYSQFDHTKGYPGEGPNLNPSWSCISANIDSVTTHPHMFQWQHDAIILQETRVASTNIENVQKISKQHNKIFHTSKLLQHRQQKNSTFRIPHGGIQQLSPRQIYYHPSPNRMI